MYPLHHGHHDRGAIPEEERAAFLSRVAEGQSCRDCGIETPDGGKLKLKVHFIDGDDTNFSPSNIAILCEQCLRREKALAGPREQAARERAVSEAIERAYRPET